MQSKAINVDTYLKEVPAYGLSSLIKLRELCRKELKGYEETMRYGMPCYEKNNVVEVGFASQKKQHSPLYFKTRRHAEIQKRVKGRTYWQELHSIYKA